MNLGLADCLDWLASGTYSPLSLRAEVTGIPCHAWLLGGGGTEDPNLGLHACVASSKHFTDGAISSPCLIFTIGFLPVMCLELICQFQNNPVGKRVCILLLAQREAVSSFVESSVP